MPVARVTSGGGRGRRISVEATPGAQPNQDLRAALLEPLLQFDGVVARVEDKQRDRCCGLFLLGQPAEQPFHLLAGDCVGVVRGRYALDVHTGAVQLSRTKLSRAMNW